MAEKLHFSLVTPEKQLFSGEVDQVVVPGTEGDFGVLPNHAPVMSTIRPGWITVFSDGTVERVVVRGGFAEVTPAGLTILAEEATPASQIDVSTLDSRIRDAQEDLNDAADEIVRTEAQQRLDYLHTLRDATATVH